MLGLKHCETGEKCQNGVCVVDTAILQKVATFNSYNNINSVDCNKKLKF
jgi:hypothetical protein